MKKISRIMCLVLVVLIGLLAFTACGDDGEEVSSVVAPNDNTSSQEEIEIVETADAGFTFKDQAISVVISEDGVEKCDVVEGTTLKAFTDNIELKDGYTAKVLTADGKDVTDEKAKIVSGMVFKVLKGTEETASYEIVVKSAEQIQQTVQTASSQAAAAEKNPASTSSKGGSTSSKAPTSNTKPVSSLKGYNFKLGTIYKGAFTASDPAAKANQTQIAKIKSRYGCTVEYVDYSGGYEERLTKEVTADNASADVIQLDLGICRKLAREGYLADWSKSSTLDLKKTYNNASTKCQTYNGKTFGIAYASMSGEYVMGVLFNKKLVEQYGGGTDIYALYKANKWTSENFKTLSETIYKNSNGNVAGFASNTNIIGMAMTSFAGGTALMKNGKVEATLCTQNSIESMKWCKELFNGKSWKYNSSIDKALIYFANKEAAMFVTYLNKYVTVASSGGFEMGFVPMPLDPRQGKYISGTYNGSFYVVPNTTKNKQSLNAYGEFMNMLAGVSTYQINNTANSMKRNGFDNTAVEVYKAILNKYLLPEFSTMVFPAQFAQEVDNSILIYSQDPSSVMNGLKQRAQKLCDDFYNFNTKFQAK